MTVVTVVSTAAQLVGVAVVLLVSHLPALTAVGGAAPGSQGSGGRLRTVGSDR